MMGHALVRGLGSNPAGPADWRLRVEALSGGAPLYLAFIDLPVGAQNPARYGVSVEQTAPAVYAPGPQATHPVPLDTFTRTDYGTGSLPLFRTARADAADLYRGSAMEFRVSGSARLTVTNNDSQTHSGNAQDFLYMGALPDVPGWTNQGWNQGIFGGGWLEFYGTGLTGALNLAPHASAEADAAVNGIWGPSISSRLPAFDAEGVFSVAVKTASATYAGVGWMGIQATEVVHSCSVSVAYHFARPSSFSSVVPTVFNGLDCPQSALPGTFTEYDAYLPDAAPSPPPGFELHSGSGAAAEYPLLDALTPGQVALCLFKPLPAPASTVYLWRISVLRSGVDVGSVLVGNADSPDVVPVPDIVAVYDAESFAQINAAVDTSAANCAFAISF
jgi:hypothetical protein